MKRKKSRRRATRPRYQDDFDSPWPAQASVDEVRTRAARGAKKLARTEDGLEPVSTTDRSITKTFWGKAWCKNLEHYSDYQTRLPRGRSYLRTGCVLDLKILGGRIEAKVQGSHLYDVVVKITQLDEERWQKVRDKCKTSVHSALDLLAGKLDGTVMKLVTDPDEGLFPAPSEIKLSCTCPDWADMCKHLAAVLYGIGVRLDEKPELLFKLRGVDHLELVAAAAEQDLASGSEELAGVDLSEMFGIDLEDQ